MLRPGVFSRTYTAGSLDEICKSIRNHGIEDVQFNLSSAGLPVLPDYVEDEKLEEIKETVHRNGIKLHALSGTFNMIDPDEDRRARGCRQFAEQCRIARFLEIPIVTLCTGSKDPCDQWRWHDDNRSEAAWNDLMRSTETIIRYAEELSIVLAVEPEIGNIICSPAIARKYLDAVGSRNLKIVIDGANLFHNDELDDMHGRLDEAFDMLGGDIVLAHGKDVRGGNAIAYVPPGEGTLDYEYYFTLLKRYGYDGAVMMHGLPEDKVLSGRNHLQSCIDAAWR